MVVTSLGRDNMRRNEAMHVKGLLKLCPASDRRARAVQPGSLFWSGVRHQAGGTEEETGKLRVQEVLRPREAVRRQPKYLFLPISFYDLFFWHFT